MAYAVIFLATRWGSELGGINVFNTGLALGMAQVLPKGSRCICYVEQTPGPDAQHYESVEIRVAAHSADLIIQEMRALAEEFEQGTLQGILLVGHDVKTGNLAVDSATALKSELTSVPVLSSVVSHMDYFEYLHKKGQPFGQVADRSREQFRTVSRADRAFAVGPLLQASFQSARSGSNAGTPVIRLLPGAADIADQPLNERPGLLVFISGRLNLEDDTIKNGVLAIEALLDSYRRGREADDDLWKYRGKLFACGVDAQRDRALLMPLEQRAQRDSAFEVHAVPFDSAQSKIFEYLASAHFALMPSWHEGFGLTGWEALCAGVPLICSRQSGLAMLLDDLRQQLPDVPFHSIEYVNLAGSGTPGKPTEQDIRSLSDAIGRITADLPDRKKAAQALAKRLKRDFTWARTAIELFSQTGWVLPSSAHWLARRQFAHRMVAGSQDKPQDSDVIDQVFEIIDALDLDRDWGTVCTAFDYFSEVGKKVQLVERKTLYAKLRQIGHATAGLLPRYGKDDREICGSIRDSGCLDVCWRYMAACAGIATNFGDFVNLFDSRMIDAINSDSFLTKELIFYASRFSAEFSRSATNIASEFFRPVSERLESEIDLQKRLARLMAVFPEWKHIFPLAGGYSSFQQEYACCLRVAHMSYDVAALIDQDPDIAPTLLALMSLRPDPTRQLADQAIEFIHRHEGSQIRGQWRGDKRLFAGLVSTGVSTKNLLPVLSAMAKDEDETIRWAAISLAFSPILRSRLEAAQRAQHSDVGTELNSVLGAVVDSAVTADAGHPWLHREFLHHYLQEHANPRDRIGLNPLTIADFPVSRTLFGAILTAEKRLLIGNAHPEVLAALNDARKTIKRVLFVLPPIEMSVGARTRSASYTSTPPLGMGLVASYLLIQGHDVQLLDCHRFPHLCDAAVHHASHFDLFGIYTVFSTLRSTVDILKEIRKRTLRTLLVVGGPAAKLDSWQHALLDAEGREAWDFAISGDALENLRLLLSELDGTEPWPASSTLIANEDSPILAFRDVSPTEQETVPPKKSDSVEPEWTEIILDRRLFSSAAGQYEPGRTRLASQAVLEAHIVMSQGCNWDCAFCTERKTLSGGEKRRPAKTVLQEVARLARRHENLRIQFVDDNLLPQIAALAENQLVMRAAAMEWTETFLNELVHVRNESQGVLRWRGIFRLEDFLEYESCFRGDRFIRRLADSGCSLLAFGVEHGDEERRRKLKNGKSISNQTISDIFQRLRQAGIYTKAYFMLGGRWESLSSAVGTIDFALQSGVTLAYFALYKEFVRASRELRQQRMRESDRSRAFLEYRQLIIDWDDLFGANATGAAPRTPMSLAAGPITAIERECYGELSSLGFRFEDIIKYNDYHGEIGESAELLAKISWDKPYEYFSVVEQAYRRFYLRPKFVEDYKLLIEAGY